MSQLPEGVFSRQGRQIITLGAWMLGGVVAIAAITIRIFVAVQATQDEVKASVTELRLTMTKHVTWDEEWSKNMALVSAQHEDRIGALESQDVRPRKKGAIR